MKKIISFLSIFFSLPATTTFGQEPIQCGTAPGYTALDTADVPWYGNNNLLYEYLDQHDEYLIDRIPVEIRSGEECPEIEAALAIPIKFWIWRENETDNPIDERDIQFLLDVLNQAFVSNGLNFRFYTYCTEFPINADFVNVDDSDELDELNNNGRHDPLAINVHVVETGEGSNGAWAGVYNSSDDFVAIRRSTFSTEREANRVFPHEIGHYFGLDHTHQFTSNLFHTGTACCKAEPVTRGKKWHKPCIGCIWVGIPWYNKRCNRTGDYLCDTDADPWGSFNNDFDNPPCEYTGTWEDGYGDVFHPDVRNYMSYYSGCTNRFSNQQKGIMLWQIFTTAKRLFIYATEVNIIDPDKYEPDNSDFVGVPRLISVGETQCHSMSTVYEQEECNDTEDWLRIENENGLLGSYRIVVRDVDGSDNPVEDVIIHNTNNLQEKTDEIAVTFTDNGSERIWEIPCDIMVPNTNTADPNDFNDFLVQIIKGENEGGLYTVSLEITESLPNVKQQEQICVGETFTVVNPPDGATVSWTSENINISSSTGTSVTITGTSPTGPYRLNATVSHNGCSYTIRREFSSVGSTTLPPIGNISMQVIGPPCEPNFIFSIPQVQGATYYDWNCSSSPISNGYFNGCYGGNGTVAYADAYIEYGESIIVYVTVTASNDCGVSASRSRGFTYQPDGDCDMHLTGCGADERFIKITPNPVSSTEFTFEIIDGCTEPVDYQIIIISQYGELYYIIESTDKIHQISSFNFNDGLYYAKVITETGVTTATFLIQY